MKTAFLIYRPVMDYEESETSYLICTTLKKAEKVRFEMIVFANDILASMKSLYDEEGDQLQQEAWQEAMDFNRAKIAACKWPYDIDLESDIDQWNFQQGSTRFDATCIAVRELPLI